MTLPTRQARPRRSSASYFVAQPVSLPVFRELLADAPSDAWIALVPRSNPTQPGFRRSTRFEVQLVIPSASRVERLSTFRGGIRQWSAVDRAILAIDALRCDAGRAGDLEVFFISSPS